MGNNQQKLEGNKMNKKMTFVKGTMALIVGVSIISTPLITAYAASNEVKITMERRYVSGKANNKFHSLNKGTVKLNVSAKGFGKSKPSSSIALYKSRIGVDQYYGRVSVSSGANYYYKNKTKEFPTKADKKSSDYYLVAEKAMDRYTVKIEGKVSN